MAEEKTFSAKQVASRIGTQAKTLRKFFRDSASGYKAVGQGGRYEFPEEDLPKIKEAFEAWNAGKVKRHRPTNAERQLAEKAGLVPTPRKTAESRTPRRKRNPPPESLFDGDDLMTRIRSSIGERAKAKGLTTNKQGRWVPIEDKKLITVEDAKKLVPGFAKKVDEADQAWQERKKLFDEALEEVVHESQEPTDEELEELDEVLDLDDEELES